MLAAFARWLLGLFGWRVDFNGMPGPKGVAIFYPHTSNWDFVIGLLAKWVIAVPVHFVGKESLFRGFTGATLGRLMYLWGGRPVDRHHASGAVEQLAALMRKEDFFWLALSPEGTRSYLPFLRTGFYYLALKLDLPVGLAYIDYARKRIGVTEFARMTGDEARDLATIRAYYADKVARHPEKASAIAFRNRASGV
ncbi:MAG: 1-acyl-sn-glycerol-3-phosphate acyltransferase [Gemmatimonadota bacterium]